jgi:ABC-type antimicrobial peptide transport system permease subunit
VPEFGVRIALGSSRAEVLRSALATCLVPVVVGLGVGLGGALLSSAALTSVLFGVTPKDPATFALSAGTLLGVATLAALLPAWRASRVDPVTVLGAD